MNDTETSVFPAYDAMVLPILCVLALFVINREGLVTRNEAYTVGVCLVLLYLPFTRHSLSVSANGLCLRHSILPRRRRYTWTEVARIGYRMSAETVRLDIHPRTGRRQRICLNLQKEGATERFLTFLEQARDRLGPSAVTELPCRCDK